MVQRSCGPFLEGAVFRLSEVIRRGVSPYRPSNRRLEFYDDRGFLAPPSERAPGNQTDLRRFAPRSFLEGNSRSHTLSLHLPPDLMKTEPGSWWRAEMKRDTTQHPEDVWDC